MQQELTSRANVQKNPSQPTVRRMPFAPEMVLPLRQGMTGAARPIVKEGREVVRGEPIAEPLEFLSVALHAPATGVVERIGECVMPDGAVEPAIYLRVYRASSQEILYGRAVDVDALSRDELIHAIREAGLIGLNGLGFPTHAKLDVPNDKSIDTVIVSAFEGGAGSSVAERVLIERAADIVAGLRVVLRAAGAGQAVLVAHAGQAQAVEAVRRLIPADGAVRVTCLPDLYPQGRSQALVKAVLGRGLSAEGLPLDVGAAVFHVSTLAAIGELLPRQGGLIERLVTFAGPGIDKPGNYLVPIGTPLEFALAQVGLRASATQVYLGSAPSAPVENRTIPITKEVHTVLVQGTGTAVAAPTNGANGGGLARLLKRLLS